MTTIWKWPLQQSTEIAMPQGSIVLDVQMQGDTPCLWALVNTEAPTELRRFEIHGTGRPMEVDPGDYLGTFQMSAGVYVFHVFEVTDRK